MFNMNFDAIDAIEEKYTSVVFLITDLLYAFPTLSLSALIDMFCISRFFSS